MSDPDLFEVVISESAEADLRAMAAYLDEHAGPAVAVKFVDSILERVASLEHMPHRGSLPKELEGINRKGYRQLVEGKYRIFYTVAGRRVQIALIADERRDMEALLTARLLVP